MSESNSVDSGERNLTAKTKITGGFWHAYQELVNDAVLPYQWSVLNDEIDDAPKSHSIENFRIAAGLSDGEYFGMVFQDSDLAKWLEAAGHSLRYAKMNGKLGVEKLTKLESQVKTAVETVIAAQQPDGYLNTYFTVKEPDSRWTNLRDAHELYCAGHMIEAAVSIYEATGQRELLDAMIKFVDHIEKEFGPGPRQRRGYPGHQEIELALTKLYKATGERRFFDLAQFFIDERGTSPNYFEIEASDPRYKPIWEIDDGDHSYRQAHKPVRDQDIAVGHSVRALYQYIAMADIALETQDSLLVHACKKLWESVTERRLYVTGGIGSTRHGEAFTADFDLPNDTIYAESCAAIGLFIFSNRMASLTNDSHYADIGEQALFNAIISGLSLDGTSYFYVNPLEVKPEFCDSSGTYEHVKYRRQPWYGCACCPPNIARIISSLGDYTCRTSDSILFVDHFFTGNIESEMGDELINIEIEGQYPWTGDLKLRIGDANDRDLTIALRIPGWCSEPSIKVNDTFIDVSSITQNGYAHIKRLWNSGDTIFFSLPMPVTLIETNPRVRANFGRVTVQRGPLIYCLEGVDNGTDLHTATLNFEPNFRTMHNKELLGGVTVISGDGKILRRTDKAFSNKLYQSAEDSIELSKSELVFIPHYAWANREVGEMIVWVRQEGR